MTTLRDFTPVFDAYATFEESVLDQLMARLDALEEADMDEAAAQAEQLERLQQVIDLRLARFERLMARRPFLANNVALRPRGAKETKVADWRRRVALYDNASAHHLTERTYATALRHLDPAKASPDDLAALWIAYARHYIDRHPTGAAGYRLACDVFERALEVPYKTVHALGDVWIAYAEAALAHDAGGEAEAVRLLQRATSPLSARRVTYADATLPPQQRVHKHLKLWYHYLDLVESLCLPDDSDDEAGDAAGAPAVDPAAIHRVRDAYDQLFHLRLATPQLIHNYAAFLKGHHYFEAAFRAFERGIAMFTWPIVFELWNTYLTTFIERYVGHMPMWVS